MNNPTKKIKLPKKYWQKGKSKFLYYRNELWHKPDLDVNGSWKTEEKERMDANKKRREELKINQPKYPDSYYKDCYINSPEYQRHYKESIQRGIIRVMSK